MTIKSIHFTIMLMGIIKNKIKTTEYIFNKELYIACPFLSTERFIKFCNDRDINTSREQLEQFEKLRLFFPMVRVQNKKIKIKLEYLDDNKGIRHLGILEDEEKWDGPIREEYDHFTFEKNDALNRLEKGYLWSPSSRDFQEWNTFIDGDGNRKIESYYSIFQCYPLYNLIQSTKIELRAERSLDFSEKNVKDIINWSKFMIENHQKNGTRGEFASMICQLISNRYFPKTQTNRRTIRVPTHRYDSNWSWDEYRKNWNAKDTFEEIGITIEELKALHEYLSITAKKIDPLERWYELINFVSVTEKERLKGKALLAQTLYSMERMLKLFYEEITGEKIYSSLETERLDRVYGEGVAKNELEYLEFLTNRYHLNPKPRLILVVEGDGEFEQIPLLSEKLLGLPFPRLGIQIVNLQGIGDFEGNKRKDKYGALEKFIDYHHHNRQTFVFVILDNEGRANDVKERLIKKKSRFNADRKVTNSEYIHLWEEKTIEFSNFTNGEIAKAMTEIGQNRYEFKDSEITDSRNRTNDRDSDVLSKIYKKKLEYDLPKKELLEKLFGIIHANPESEFDENGKPRRPVVQLLVKIIELAAKNHQPTSTDLWKKNQESGLFGDIILKT